MAVHNSYLCFITLVHVDVHIYNPLYLRTMTSVLTVMDHQLAATFSIDGTPLLEQSVTVAISLMPEERRCVRPLGFPITAPADNDTGPDGL